MSKHKTSEDLFERIRQYLPASGVDRVIRAYEFAKRAHEGQLRKSGDDYITHPLQVAYILADLEQDAATISAALLHDTIEDSDVNKQDIVDAFGADVYTLVEGVTKLGQIHFESKEEKQAENFRKMFLAMAKDLRVVLIKLADRLHNMRTLRHLPEAKQKEIALETREIFSPLAHRLGMWSLKWELEDLAFYYLQYDEFQKIKAMVASRRDEREAYVNSFLSIVQKLLADVGIQAIVTGRPKHFYSIYKKLRSQGLSYDELYDVLGSRVILNSVRDCYEALGVIHAAFKPVTGRFKDYIAMPKSNMYQSLHTTVIGPQGKMVEIQLRTKDMHQVAEFGIAAHWRYKEGKIHTRFDADFSWLRQIIESQKDEVEPSSFLQTLKVDLFIDEVFVFTPKGEVQMLPKGATPIDFAYKIHTEIGHTCMGAKVNGHIVPLHHALQNSDQVEILTAKRQTPKLDWLNFVQTGYAKSKIKHWFRKQRQQQNIEEGRAAIEKTFALSGYVAKEVLTEANIRLLLDKFKAGRWEELCLMVAHGEITAKAVVHQVDLVLRPPMAAVEEPPKKRVEASTAVDGVRVLGEDNILVHFARCCAPVPGEPIVGVITQGHGVSIHRRDCTHIVHMPEVDRIRLIDVEWTTAGPMTQRTFAIKLQIDGFDRVGLLKDIVNQISNIHTNIKDIKSRIQKDGTVRLTLSVEVHDHDHLNKIRNAITQVPDVIDVYRPQR
jgi:GTP pyrophosphokinase